ncbi:MAG: Ig-like domain-containing protein, partial [Akkermansiaceae bacterium]|nr:Ig-like domain-containing protein [Akkermansiaceae bacterium]
GDNDGVFLDHVSVTAAAIDGTSASTTTLTRHPGTGSTSTYGTALSFDVTVTGGFGTPAGTATLKDGGTGGTTLGSATLTNGACTITTPTLAVGTHTNIVAVYGGNSTYATSTSGALTQTVNNPSITATAGANGTVSPAGVTVVNYNGSQSYAITPASGYVVGDVLVDGSSVGLKTSHVFSNITANHTIAASFVANPSAATGTYTVNQIDNKVIYKFTGNGTFTPASGLTADILVVGGGGSGGGKATTSTYWGGGGGAGGLIAQNNIPLIAQQYAITVGDGGAGGTSGAKGGSGTNSVFGSLYTAMGGGGGGSGATTSGANTGAAGGSTGGGGRTSSNGAAGTPATAGQGTLGVAAASGRGGGGGAGAVASAQNGGAGINSSISGSSTGYAGGGGAGGATAGTASHGGGAGIISGTPGTAGTANTGGGGGGVGSTSGTGGAGGSGIVIVSYTIKAPSTITFDALPAKTLGDPPFHLTATATSGLPVSYASSDPAVASVNGSLVTLLLAGTTTITASQPGDGNHNPANPVPQTLTVNPAPLSAFAAWAADTAQGLTAGVNDGPMDDPYHDGILNLLEFTLGGNPLESSRAILPKLTKPAGDWFFEYKRSVLSKSSTTQTVEYGSDLTGRAPLTVPPASAGMVTITPGTTSDHVKVTLPPLGASGFVRLKVSQ